MLVPDSSGTIQYFLNILYWFEEERNTTGNGFMFFLLLVQKKEPNLPAGRQGKAHRQ